MPCFINLPLRWVLADESWLTWFVASRVEPELGLDASSLTQPLAWHKGIARTLAEHGLACSVHLPFLGLKPGSENRELRDMTADSLARAVELAELYQARHMVGHPGFEPDLDAEPNGRDRPGSRWLEQAAEAWGLVADRTAIPLYLENIYDPSPRVVADLVQLLASPHVGICFDAGHWFHFSKGWINNDLAEWIDVFAPYLRHLHLHDNDGQGDQHLGMGEGKIPFAALIAEIRSRSLCPTATCEPHSLADYQCTAAWMAQHPDAAELLAWRPAVETDRTPPPEQY